MCSLGYFVDKIYIYFLLLEVILIINGRKTSKHLGYILYHINIKSEVNSLDYALVYFLIPFNTRRLEKCSKNSREIAICI